MNADTPPTYMRKPQISAKYPEIMVIKSERMLNGMM
jgi:hypothetical protein